MGLFSVKREQPSGNAGLTDADNIALKQLAKTNVPKHMEATKAVLPDIVGPQNALATIQSLLAVEDLKKVQAWANDSDQELPNPGELVTALNELLKFRDSEKAIVNIVCAVSRNFRTFNDPILVNAITTDLFCDLADRCLSPSSNIFDFLNLMWQSRTAEAWRAGISEHHVSIVAQTGALAPWAQQIGSHTEMLQLAIFMDLIDFVTGDGRLERAIPAAPLASFAREISKKDRLIKAKEEKLEGLAFFGDPKKANSPILGFSQNGRDLKHPVSLNHMALILHRLSSERGDSNAADAARTLRARLYDISPTDKQRIERIIDGKQKAARSVPQELLQL